MPTADAFLSRLGQAEERDTHRVDAMAAKGIRVHSSQRGQPPPRMNAQQQQLQVAHAVRQQQRQNGVVQTNPLPQRQAPARLGGGQHVLGADVPAQTYLTPQAARIQKMLESGGGAQHSAFFASETSKFNSGQPNARRGQESSIVFGTPSPQEQARYLEHLMTR